LPPYRGQGLAKHINEWAKKIVKPYIETGYELMAYATVGSNILYSAGKRIEEISGKRAMPLNIAYGIVEVDRACAINNLDGQVLIKGNEDNNLNSTIQVSTIADSLFGDISLICSASKYFNGYKISKKNYVPGKNIFVKLPILLDILIVRETNIAGLKSEIEKYKKNKRKLKLCVPLHSSYKQVIQYLLKHKYSYFVGFSIVDGYLMANYQVGLVDNKDKITEYLCNHVNVRIADFGKMIRSEN
jgi:hypothetical protein